MLKNGIHRFSHGSGSLRRSAVLLMMGALLVIGLAGFSLKTAALAMGAAKPVTNACSLATAAEVEAVIGQAGSETKPTSPPR